MLSTYFCNVHCNLHVNFFFKFCSDWIWFLSELHWSVHEILFGEHYLVKFHLFRLSLFTLLSALACKVHTHYRSKLVTWDDLIYFGNTQFVVLRESLIIDESESLLWGFCIGVVEDSVLIYDAVSWPSRTEPSILRSSAYLTNTFHKWCVTLPY